MNQFSNVKPSQQDVFKVTGWPDIPVSCQQDPKEYGVKVYISDLPSCQCFESNTMPLID